MLSIIQKFARPIRRTAAVSGLLIVLALPLSVAGQIEALFDTAAVIGNVRHEYRLSSRDIKVLRPLITRESTSLVHILSECRDVGEQDYIRLWNKVLISRREFESERVRGLARRQKTALRAVRTKFETLVLEQWTDDHIQQLGEVLELDWIQFNLIGKIFDAESRSRLKLLAARSAKNAAVDLEWQKVTLEREQSLKLILSEQQLQDYLQLTQPIEKLLS